MVYKKMRINKYLAVVLPIFILSIMAMLVIDHINFTKRQDHVVQAATSEGVTLYLPFTANRYPLQTVFGIETNPYGPGFSTLVELKTSWVRYNSLEWSSVETVKGARDWGAVATLEASLTAAVQNGIEVVLIVRSTPDWAQQIAGASCGPIKDSELAAFGQFLYDAVQRYSKPPFNVKYWEIWNEPDVAYVDALADAPYGCWGDYDNKYFGGGYYADVLKIVYPKIKAANPSAQVLIGGLLLDCDPRGTTSYCDIVKHDERPPKYLEGILINGGGNYFDGVSFHAYDYFPNYAPAIGHYSNANWGAAWDTTGPVSSLKTQFIREILSKYGVTNKFLMNTESAVICGQLPTDPGCEPDDSSPYELTKASYVAQVYGSAIKDNLRSNVWFSLIGWRNSGLLYADLTPRPAFTAYEASRAILKDAAYVRAITTYAGVRVLEYQRVAHTIWLAWSLDGNTHSITLPSLPTYMYTNLGATITPSTTIDITLSPVYIDWY